MFEIRLRYMELDACGSLDQCCQLLVGRYWYKEILWVDLEEIGIWKIEGLQWDIILIA